jgi:hypothetical protein
MSATTHDFKFNGQLLNRGFWLYVWEITLPGGAKLYYVGRTGDSSSSNAQSPFNRMGQHLGFNDKSNVLRRRLRARGIDPAKCVFRLVAHGPVLEEATTRARHLECRDRIAALERALATAMAASGYDVMNTVNCRVELDAETFVGVRAAFAAHFKNLASGPET